MTYNIRMDARTADGEKLGMVQLRHAPDDADKIVSLRAHMLSNGWQGRPVILSPAGDYHIALTGTHRLSAAQGIDDLIAAVYLPELTTEQWETIEHAHDDDDLLAAFVAIGAERDDMAEVIATMRAEVESN